MSIINLIELRLLYKQQILPIILIFLSLHLFISRKHLIIYFLLLNIPRKQIDKNYLPKNS